ncbi:hypothetical protein [endosymbiont of Lamellibrachia barhami]|uniref:hypothetical protein n=1 Tax=endosymbiont of Lamellibrachia barhami TaxID=205975 RepID=UPI0015AB8AED|nr:hypothetical protein [endosymbiont of Lamellibrachia barhami]
MTNNNRMSKHFYIIVLIIIGITLSSCHGVLKFPEHRVIFPNKEKIDLNVRLHIGKDIADAIWESDTFNEKVIVLGESLSSGVEGVSRAVFSNVEVAKGKDEKYRGGSEAILAPSLKYLKKSIPVLGFQDTHTTIVMEWLLKDSLGNIIWADSFSVHKKFQMMSSHKKTKIYIRELLDELFEKTFESLSESPEIRTYAALQNRGRK